MARRETVQFELRRAARDDVIFGTRSAASRCTVLWQWICWTKNCEFRIDSMRVPGSIIEALRLTVDTGMRYER